jgi:acetyl/propionyl-CoA carboxylase alpha subunit
MQESAPGLLIANRGEIAIRIARAAADIGLRKKRPSIDTW